LRDQAAAILLGNLPEQGEEEAGTFSALNKIPQRICWQGG
jgi:hypothetical protein